MNTPQSPPDDDSDDDIFDALPGYSPITFLFAAILGIGFLTTKKSRRNQK